MKIFSNFDTKFRDRMLEEKILKYSSDKVFVIHRSHYFLLIRVLFPFFVLVLLALIGCFFLAQNDWMMFAIYPLAIVWFLIIWFRPFHKLLKYLYDFAIVDPHWITTYKQKWILKSSIKEIPANRIRSIQIERNSILENIFSYGSIDIITDFTENMQIGLEDEESASVIGLTYVDHPLKIKSRITDICFK